MLQRFEISGMSMSPTLQPGDRVLVRTGGKICAGDCIVFVKAGLKMIKRAVQKIGTRWHVRGDNLNESTDSLEYGEIEERSIVGRVIYRY